MSNHFIDESVMCRAGEPIEYVPVHRPVPGLVVSEASQEEYDEAHKIFVETLRRDRK